MQPTIYQGGYHERVDGESALVDAGVLQAGGDAEKDLDRGSCLPLGPICCALPFKGQGGENIPNHYDLLS